MKVIHFAHFKLGAQAYPPQCLKSATVIFMIILRDFVVIMHFLPIFDNLATFQVLFEQIAK